MDKREVVKGEELKKWREEVMGGDVGIGCRVRWEE